MSKKKPIMTPRPGPKLNRPTRYPSTPEEALKFEMEAVERSQMIDYEKSIRVLLE